MENLTIWNAVERPPSEALKPIRAGRLKGKSDISPQWRMKALTEQFGPCGIGWRYEITKLWTEPGDNGQVFAFAMVNLYYKHEGEWSEAVPGIGGSMLVVNESKGPYSSDEAFKMAVTDALSVAMKALGVAAAIYSGLWDGSKYTDEPDPAIAPAQVKELDDLLVEVGADKAKFLQFFSISNVSDLPTGKYRQAVAMLEAKRKAK